MKIALKINTEASTFEADPDMPLLWLIRDEAKLKGTKFGCGKGICGACSVHIDGELVRSCLYPAHMAHEKAVTTIEGLSKGQDRLHFVQQAWLEVQVPQCGYCQPGFMMAAADFLKRHKNPTEEDIKNSISNICRCGTYPRIIKAILLAAQTKNHESID